MYSFVKISTWTAHTVSFKGKNNITIDGKDLELESIEYLIQVYQTHYGMQICNSKYAVTCNLPKSQTDDTISSKDQGWNENVKECEKSEEFKDNFRHYNFFLILFLFDPLDVDEKVLCTISYKALSSNYDCFLDITTTYVNLLQNVY